MRLRTDLQSDLQNVLDSPNVYFQPSSNVQMAYPAIVYELDGISSRKANNKIYMAEGKYTVTHIYKSIKSQRIERFLMSFDFISFDREFKSDGLYHDIFTIYY